MFLRYSLSLGSSESMISRNFLKFYFLNKIKVDEGLEELDLGGVIDDELQEHLVDGLDVRPEGVDELVGNLVVLVLELFFEHRQRTEDVAADHFHQQFDVGDTLGGHLIVVQH